MKVFGIYSEQNIDIKLFVTKLNEKLNFEPEGNVYLSICLYYLL